MLCGGTRSKGSVEIVGGANGSKRRAYHDGQLMEVAVVKSNNVS